MLYHCKREPNQTCLVCQQFSDLSQRKTLGNEGKEEVDDEFEAERRKELEKIAAVRSKDCSFEHFSRIVEELFYN